VRRLACSAPFRPGHAHEWHDRFPGETIEG
jgi:hypothetical protein